ncbi:17960_t:CDS:2 [Entrophospora sp. SA101]|nr:17960_t:CDS:2 [Entrophospora sp. SA101]
MVKTAKAFQEKVEISQMLRKWLEPRLAPKLDKGLSCEQAWGEIIKEISINALSTLPLSTFATAISNLNQMNVSKKIRLIEKILNITPHPENASGETINKISAILVSILLPKNNPNGISSSDIDVNFMKITKTILRQSHGDWIDANEVLSNFLNICSASYNFEKNVYVLYPFLNDVTKFVKSLNNNQKTGMDKFFSCLQRITIESGYRLNDLIQINVPDRQKDFSERFLNNYIPRCVPLIFHCSGKNISDMQRDYLRHNKKSLKRPCWHNQHQLILLILQKAPNYTMSHNELIDASITLDERLSAETGLPRVFSGQSPKSSASFCLVNNSEKYFKELNLPYSKNIYYKLAFIPNDIDDAIRHYNNWMRKLINHDWPLCFGKLKKNKQGSTIVNSGHVVMLSVGTTTQFHLRCRQCAADTNCDMKLPSCTKCRTKGTLCVYQLQTVELNKKHQTRKSKNIYDNNVKFGKFTVATDEEIIEGLDLTNVPKSLADVVEIKKSTIRNAGNGLFAKINLPIATPLGFYFGVPMSEDEFDQNKDKVGRSSHYSMRYKDMILDATDDNGQPFTDPKGKIHCPFHFMNEDPFGNIVFLEGSTVNQVICWTKRDIKKGEELFVYYGRDVDREHWGRAVKNGDGKIKISDYNVVGTPTKQINKKKRNKQDYDDDNYYNYHLSQKSFMVKDIEKKNSAIIQFGKNYNDNDDDNSNKDNYYKEIRSESSRSKKKQKNNTINLNSTDNSKSKNENGSNKHHDDGDGDEPDFKTRRRVLRRIGPDNSPNDLKLYLFGIFII